MSKPLTLIGIALAILFALTASTAVSARVPAYSEGIYVDTWVRYEGKGVRIIATKNVDGRWRETQVQLNSWYGYDAALYGAAILEEDPDGLEVSRDLGWGGLEGQITVQSHSGTPHLVEFHIWQFADEPGYTEDPDTGYFIRNASLEGYVLFDGEIFMDFRGPPPPNLIEQAYNFSDQWPGY